MRSWTGLLAQAATVAVLTALAGAAPTVAQQVIPVNAPTAGPAARASDKQVADFKANPASLLRGNPLGGLQLSALVKSLVLADPSLADTIIGLAPQGNSMQVPSLGSGIGQALRILQGVDAKLAQSVQEKAIATKNEALIAGLEAGLKDTQTFSTGAGGGFGGVSGGGSGPVGGVGTGSGGSGNYVSQPGSFSLSNSGYNQTFSSGASVTCTRSVSPRRNCS